MTKPSTQMTSTGEPGGMPVHPSDIACRVVRLLDGEGRRAHLLLEEVPMIEADGDGLSQVVNNLLRNALDYSPAREPVEVEVARRCLAREEGCLVVMNGEAHLGAAHDCQPAVSVAVRDRGAGMTAEDLQHAFEAPATPDASGPGLVAARAIIDRHGGRLWAQSLPNEGSIFGFCLPASTLRQGGAR